jgi:predicted PurR-regulated permease PerM
MHYLISLFGRAKAVVNVLSSAFIIAILSFYMLKDWKTIAVTVKKYIPHNILDFSNFAIPNIKKSLKKQLLGQMKVCFIMAAMYSLCLYFIGVKPFFLIGILSGILTFVPFVGVFIAFFCALFTALGQGLGIIPDFCLGIVYFLGASVDSNFLTPKLVGSQIGLHPIWIFFAVLSTLAIFGLSGALFVMPLATLISGILKNFASWLEEKESIKN